VSYLFVPDEPDLSVGIDLNLRARRSPVAARANQPDAKPFANRQVIEVEGKSLLSADIRSRVYLARCVVLADNLLIKNMAHHMPGGKKVHKALTVNSVAK
jgi:hypothetical protein